MNEVSKHPKYTNKKTWDNWDKINWGKSTKKWKPIKRNRLNGIRLVMEDEKK